MVPSAIDVGLQLHVVVREARPVSWQTHEQDGALPPRRLWFAGEVQFEDLEKLMARFNVSICAIDIQPERHKAAEFAQSSRPAVWLVDYNRHEPGYDASSGLPRMVHAHRVDFMDQVVERFRRQQVSLPKDARRLGGRVRDGQGEYYRELMAPQRVPFRDGHGNLDYRWDERHRDDHYFHAELYALLADQLSGRGLIRTTW
jgi:hypothetical protein